MLAGTICDNDRIAVAEQKERALRWRRGAPCPSSDETPSSNSPRGLTVPSSS
ncbi:hypothetical protein TGAM01_v206859 [Trichoderma gamsii]|uniref:Uncharacterized protein n=1 Tax=Trichoderma gamsii TaxID=398673 RepID=A0A2P4ZIQ5_9HYPO|nr:hypothetical protein TGAM01_v206859 [Trichoderma gamsii]PON24171.1 hypothetical protein TGAM01_v206859 [Trichoderma gamsii]